MVKNVLLTALFSILILLYCSCSVSPTYSRKDIESVITKICKEEFNIEVKVWEKGDTIWIYAPFDKILGEDNQLDKKVSEGMRRIFLSLRRVILSMDTPPKFYAFVVSDIKTIGADLYYIDFIPDMIKFNMEFISINEMQEREVFFNSLNPQALGDKEGKHISTYEITMGEFIAYLIKQKMERTFTSPEVKDNFKINESRTNYYHGRIEITFDIMVQKYKEGLPYPFDEAVNITKKFLKIYEFPEDIKEIEIKDTFNKKNRFYTKRSLMEEK
jgi:hypothetical protein